MSSSDSSSGSDSSSNSDSNSKGSDAGNDEAKGAALQADVDTKRIPPIIEQKINLRNNLDMF